MTLTDAKIRTFKLSDKLFEISDSHDSYLVFKPDGSCHWYPRSV
jgi:hypothetical protein